MRFPDLGSAVSWFHPLWQDSLDGIPLRLHYRDDVEPESQLGTPEITPQFEAYLDAQPHDTITVIENRKCRHFRLPGDDAYQCPDCGGNGFYEAKRRYYRDPLSSAFDALDRMPGAWPRGLLGPHRLIVEFLECGYSVPELAGRVRMSPESLHGYLLEAFTRLANRYRDAPPTRIAWTDKSDAQRTAEGESAA